MKKIKNNIFYKNMKGYLSFLVKIILMSTIFIISISFIAWLFIMLISITLYFYNVMF